MPTTYFEIFVTPASYKYIHKIRLTFSLKTHYEVLDIHKYMGDYEAFAVTVLSFYGNNYFKVHFGATDMFMLVDYQFNKPLRNIINYFFKLTTY